MPESTMAVHIKEKLERAWRPEIDFSILHLHGLILYRLQCILCERCVTMVTVIMETYKESFLENCVITYFLV